MNQRQSFSFETSTFRKLGREAKLTLQEDRGQSLQCAALMKQPGRKSARAARVFISLACDRQQRMPGRTTGLLRQILLSTNADFYPRLGVGCGGDPGGGMSGLNCLGTPVPVIAPHFRGAF